MEQRPAGGGMSFQPQVQRVQQHVDAVQPERSVELDRLRVRFLLPAIRRGFVISMVPILCIALLLRAEHADGTTTWTLVRVVLSIGLYLVTVRLGDGLEHPTRTLRRLAVVMFLGSIGWGLLPVLVRSDSLETEAVMTFAVIANVAIVTSSCAADRRVYLAAVLPVTVLGAFGLLVLNDGVAAIMLWLLLLAGPYSYALFASTTRALDDGFDHEIRHSALVAELEGHQTELSELNAQLHVATARQATLLDERAALIAAVGHDLGSPLGAAMLTAEVLAERHDALPVDQHPILARRIHDQVHDAVVVLRDLTSSQRLSEDDIDAQRTQVDLYDIVDVVLERVAQAEQTIRSDVGANTWVWADPVLLERILDNLVANAIKYTPPTSRIDIGCAPDEGAGASDTLLWVDDDGPGLAAGMGETVFEPYVRGTSIAATSGSGVGLFLVRTFASLHGGRVWWEPSDRGGSRFVVSLPGRTVPGGMA